MRKRSSIDELVALPDDESDATQRYEQLAEIKARTMFNMVEEIDDGQCKVLFLTNAQAEFISSNQKSIERMLEAFEMDRKPHLVIEIQKSAGFSEFLRSHAAEFFEDANMLDWPGLVHERAPFLSVEAEREVENRLDLFMSNVLIPLAARTNAIVLCNAAHCECALSAAFTRMYAVMRSQWNGPPPFTVLSVSNSTIAFYHNPNMQAHWLHIRSACKAWAARDAKMIEVYKKTMGDASEGMSYRAHDLDPNGTCFILADCINAKTGSFDPGPLASLLNALISHLSNVLPGLAVRTGASMKGLVGSPSAHSLRMTSIRAMTNVPVLLLDVRHRHVPEPASPVRPDIDAARAPRPSGLLRQRSATMIEAGIEAGIDAVRTLTTTAAVTATDLLGISHGEAGYVADEAVLSRRNLLIEKGKAEIVRTSTALLNQGLCETMDVCVIAYLKEMLFGDGITSTSECRRASSAMGTPLYKAIALAEDGREISTFDGGERLSDATPEQVTETAEWLATRLFADAWSLLPKIESQPKMQGTYSHAYTERMRAFSTYARLLLSSENVYATNIADSAHKDIVELVDQLVQIDRLPTSNPLEGLRLLQAAWTDHDAATMLARRYKLVCKLLFALQLLLAFIIVVLATMSDLPPLESGNETDSSGDDDLVALLFERSDASMFAQTAFFISISVNLVISLDSMLNPRTRWRKLRSSANAMQSIIWCYRTRTGPFAVDETGRDQARPENALCEKVTAWRQQIMTSSAIATTNLQRRLPSRHMRHFQRRGHPEAGCDDHQSPLDASKYIALRVRPTMAFYEKRVPQYTWRGLLLKILILLLSGTATVLSRYNLSSLVTIATAAVFATTSWTEFSDVEHKVERYSRLISGLKDNLLWWDSLTDVQKVSVTNISRFVLRSESIIAEEQTKWMSTTDAIEAATDGAASKARGTNHSDRDVSSSKGDSA